MTRLALLIAATVILAGCFGSAPPPPPRDRYYRLLVSTSSATVPTPIPGVLLVKRLDADALLRERPILFSMSGKSYELQQHDYHYWTDPPPGMMQSQMATYLRRRGVARTVVTPNMRIRADYEIGGRIKRLERLLGGGPPRVFVEIELAMVRLSDGQPVVIDTYSAERVAADASVQSSVTAMSAALGDIFERFVSGAIAAQMAMGEER